MRQSASLRTGIALLGQVGGGGRVLVGGGGRVLVGGGGCMCRWMGGWVRVWGGGGGGIVLVDGGGGERAHVECQSSLGPDCTCSE
jgi:hypothetical protein